MRIDLANITPRQKLIIAKGLRDYQFIMENWQSDEQDFKEVYYDFYLKARWSVMTKAKNKDAYFRKLKSINPDDDLMAILCELRDEFEKPSYEFSLVSKLLHTRNPSCPIYDRKVRDYLMKEEGVAFWWKMPVKEKEAKGKSGEQQIKHDWDKLREWYDSFLKSERGKDWIAWFDNTFPADKIISDIKKIDFIIFATN